MWLDGFSTHRNGCYGNDWTDGVGIILLHEHHQGDLTHLLKTIAGTKGAPLQAGTWHDKRK